MLICLHTFKLFQLLLWITNNSIRNQLFVNTLLNGQTVLFLTVYIFNKIAVVYPLVWRMLPDQIIFGSLYIYIPLYCESNCFKLFYLSLDGLCFKLTLTWSACLLMWIFQCIKGRPLKSAVTYCWFYKLALVFMFVKFLFFSFSPHF